MKQMQIVRRRWIPCMVIAIALMLAACSEQPAAQQAPVPTDAPATDVPTESADAAADETRTVTHALGETEIPTNPQRIVSLNPMVTDNLVILDLMPIGIATFTGVDFESYEYLEETLQGVPIVGRFSEPNQEQIVQLDPDLIIGRDEDLAETYDTLSQIAPTVAVENQSDFRAWSRQVAEVVGREAEIEDIIAAYDERAAAASAAIQAAIGDESAVFLRVRPDSIRLYNDQRLGGPMLYDDLGITEPAFVEAIPDDTTYAEISLEEVPQLAEADHIFLLDQSEEGTQAPIFENPLWQNLPAVQNDQVYPVSRDTWINLGILAAGEVVATVEQALTGDPAASVEAFEH